MRSVVDLMRVGGRHLEIVEDPERRRAWLDYLTPWYPQGVSSGNLSLLGTLACLTLIDTKHADDLMLLATLRSSPVGVGHTSGTGECATEMVRDSHRDAATRSRPGALDCAASAHTVPSSPDAANGSNGGCCHVHVSRRPTPASQFAPSRMLPVHVAASSDIYCLWIATPCT